MPINLLADEMPSVKASPRKQAVNLLADEMPQSSQRPDDETLAYSLWQAIPRVGADLINAGGRAIQAVPGYYEAAKTEIPGALNVLTHHPLHAAGQMAAGIPEALLGISTIPKNLIEYGQDRLHLLPSGKLNITGAENLHMLPKEIEKKLQSLPQLTEQSVQQKINDIFGEPTYPGESLLRGAVRNAPLIGALGKTAKYLNPAKLGYGNIAEHVVDTMRRNQEIYSGVNGLYQQLEKKASKRGVDLSHINFDKIPFKNIDIPSLTTLEDWSNRNLTQAQKAISDLSHAERQLKGKRLGVGLDSEERQRLKDVTEAREYLQKNMFKNRHGIVQEDLLKEHQNIQAGYRKDVIPYTKNKAIDIYLKGEKTPKSLFKNLSSENSKFYAKKGEEHPRLKARIMANDILKNLKVGSLYGLGAAAGLGIPGGLGYLLYQHLRGEPGSP